MSLHSRLKEARLSANLTQDEVASTLGLAKSTISGYENGNREPGIATLGRMMDLYHVDANFLWQDESSFQMQLNYDEAQLIQLYRELDPYGHRLMQLILREEHARCIESANPAQ